MPRRSPKTYDELTTNVNYTITKTAKNGITKLAQQRKLTASYFLEKIGRGEIKLTPPEEEFLGKLLNN
ncbi:MAG: hypothetical protein WBA93_02730 [Microcoleaceae cyanobacterium]